MSALTFNVASNVKTIIILTYGWVSEGRVLTVKAVQAKENEAKVYINSKEGSTKSPCEDHASSRNHINYSPEYEISARSRGKIELRK